ncbi:hypothetical protein SORBI_3006G046400 [Sorghum bicolor]|uniref:Uncharacterized protein n=1 Tax=Sorghum bicolor TaxID=4558 RepID=A0A1B6PK78_SORBI|nr:hypothetical protein SORBI_3006G046400 [Sorghum bicolor]
MAHGPRPTNLMQASCLTLCRESQAHSITKVLRTRRLARLRRRLSPPELHCSISAPRRRLSPLDLGCSISTTRSCRPGWLLLLEVRGFVQARDLLLPLHRLAQVNHRSLNQQHQVSNRCDSKRQDLHQGTF